MGEHGPDSDVRLNSDNSKIDAALGTLAQTVTGHTTALAQKGNCRIEYQTYTGNGASARSFTFSGKPRLICIVGSDNYFLLAAQGIPRSVCYGGGGDEASSAVWSGNSVTPIQQQQPGTLHLQQPKFPLMGSWRLWTPKTERKRKVPRALRHGGLFHRNTDVF